MFLFKVFEEIAEQVSDCVIDAEAVQFIKNRQMTKKLYCEDVLQMLLADSDSEGEYLSFGNDDRPSNNRAASGTSLLSNVAAVHGESVHEVQTSNHFGPLLNGDGVAGVDVVFVSVGEALCC